jgi:uncharacterized damage-inducible protein DinB
MTVQPWDNLFDQLAGAHAALVKEFQATVPVVEGLAQVRRSLQAEAITIGAARWEGEPAPGEWSLRQMLEHVVAHDQKWEEGRTKGVEHYVDHGQRHIEQAAKIRTWLDAK